MKTLFVSLFAFGLLIASVNAGKVRLEPAVGEFISECPFEVDIMMDTEGVESNTVWISFFIDDTIFALSDLITDGWMFPAYTSFVRWMAWHGDRKKQETISFMWTTAKKDGVKWKWKLATLKITSLLWVKSMDFDFYAIPWFSADDSNINYLLDGQIADALTEAIWGKYTFVKWECPNYETPVIIAEDDQVVLKTQEDDTYFVHQSSFLVRAWSWFLNNISYVIVWWLLLVIIIILLKKKKEEDKDVK